MVALLLFCVAHASGQGAAATGVPVPVTAENYESVLTSTAVSIAFFHDPNNQKAEEAAHKQVEETAALLRFIATVAKIDVQQNANRALVDTFKVQDTPAVRFVHKDGQISPFDGKLEARDLVYAALNEWKLQQQAVDRAQRLAPVVHLIPTAKKAAEFIATGVSACIGFFQTKDVNSTAHQNFHQVSRLFSKVANIGEANETLAAVLNVSTMPALSVYNPEAGSQWYSGNWSTESLTEWIDVARQQYFAHLTNDNWAEFNTNREGHAVAVIIGNISDSTTTNLIVSLRSVAAQFVGKISYYYVDSEAAVELLHRFGLGEGSKPKFAIWDASHRVHYNLAANKPVSAQSVQTFCEAYVAGQLRPTFKSAPRPLQNDGPVWDTVTDTFMEVINDPTSDVIMMLYDNTTSEAAYLNEVYTMVANELSTATGLLMARMDTDTNDLFPQMQPDIPSITLFPKSHKNAPVTYQGHVRFNNIMDFVSEHAETAVDSPDEGELPASAKEVISSLITGS